MSDIRQEVTRIRALRYLDMIAPSAVVAWAGAQMVGGEDVREIVDLAILSDVRAEDVDAHLTALAEEIGLEPLTEQAAGIVAAQLVARELTRGAIEPVEAARRIWRIALSAPSAEPLLRTFVGLASEWEDSPDSRALYDEDIRSEALRLAGWHE